MKPPITIFALLISAFALGDLASVRYVVSTFQIWPDIPGVILLGLAFSQTTLLSAWFVFARANIAVRVLIAIPAAFGLLYVAAGAVDGSGNEIAHWFAIHLVAFCATAFPMAAVKCFGYQINPQGQTRPVSRMPGWQFSMWGLLSGTTAAAIALGTARHVDMPLLAIGEAVAFFSCLTAAGLLVFFVAMGIKLPEIAAMVTIPVVGVVCPFCGLLMGASGLPPRQEPQQWLLFGFCYGATIAVTVLAIRIAGYRLWRGTLATPAVEDAVDKIVC